MLTLTCKKCGGRMDVTENATIFECEYCQSLQTIPPTNNEKITQMHDRAVHHLRRSEFDKASIVYENIISENEKNAEAHWGLCLCRYGIEYVEDVRSHKRIPTCHRAQFKSILDDPEYLTALEYADPGARALYKEEAEYIDKVQKDILSISAKEEPFDIFICYKETDDETGERTKDSVLAQNLYDSLTKEGYKVFFARITLESKLGTAYEPYIFAALNSAPVMLAIGSKLSHFNAVWVKNEWSRYMALMEQGQKKTLIPCYFDMSPYDLPDAFMHLQAQDMTKIGWEQDLIRGIGKLIKKKSRSITAKAQESVKEVALTGALYVGDAVAGKPHGKGRAVYDGTNADGLPAHGLPSFRGDEYDGEWDFGQRNGRGTYIYRIGGSWSGIWLDGQQWTGKGTLWYKNGDKYEGELKHGKFSGKGTMYYQNGDCYEGEWLNGKSHGQGTIRYQKSGKSWTGEWRDDKKFTGSGVLYYKNGNSYEGELANGKRNGSGKMWYEDEKLKSYEGEWLNDQRSGQGVLIWKDGVLRYEGKWQLDERSGHGVMHYSDGTYTGEWMHDKRNGQGIFTCSDGNPEHKYEGTWKDDKRFTGYGFAAFEKEFYIGDWLEGERTGKGTYQYANGAVYTGEWKNGQRDGVGSYDRGDGNPEHKYEGTWKNGQCWTGYGYNHYHYKDKGTLHGFYVGEWLDGKRNGEGTYYSGDGNPEHKFVGTWKDDEQWTGHGIEWTVDFREEAGYCGDWLEGKKTGYGTYQWKNGNRYAGEYLNNKLHGTGVYTYASGTVYEGGFKDGKKHGKGTVTYKSEDPKEKWVGTFKEGAHWTGYGYIKNYQLPWDYQLGDRMEFYGKLVKGAPKKGMLTCQTKAETDFKKNGVRIFHGGKYGCINRRYRKKPTDYRPWLDPIFFSLQNMSGFTLFWILLILVLFGIGALVHWASKISLI